MAVSQPLFVRAVSQLRGASSPSWLRQACILRLNSQVQARSFRSLGNHSLGTKHSAHSFHSTALTKAAEDTPAIDYVLMPQYELVPESPPEVLRIPLLPTTFSRSRSGHAQLETSESVIRPEISTVSADSTHIASPSAMSEVTDNHAIELDPYDLTAKVTASAKKMGELPVETLKEVSVVKQLWIGLLDDLMGGSKARRA